MNLGAGIICYRKFMEKKKKKKEKWAQKMIQENRTVKIIKDI